MKKEAKYKILMLGKPGGTLVRTFDWHISALNNDNQDRFIVHDITAMSGQINANEYNVFWFYAKGFNPNLYMNIKRLCPKAKIICGPNILLDKPDIGLSDDWDNWYANFCRPDLHLDQVEFYSNHVKKFLPKELSDVAKCLDKCMLIDDEYYNSSIKKEYDCLVYSKKRRYDYNFEDFRNNLINLLEKNNISYYEIKSGKYGSYKREDYFSALNKSRMTVNLSLDECPGILNYESMFFNVPVIGSPHNTPINSSEKYYVHDTDFMTEKYLVRTEDAAEKYFKIIKKCMDEKLLQDIDHREFIKSHTSFQKYTENVVKLLEELV